MYRLIANPYYIKRRNISNINDDILYLKLKEKYRDLELNDYMNILNLIDNYFKEKIIQSIVEEIVNGCIFGNEKKDEDRIIERVSR
tara:strand:- start:768 stop:1025 length:258 start_codon:yes stop_codon:yes gene_type:complete